MKWGVGVALGIAALCVLMAASSMILLHDDPSLADTDTPPRSFFVGLFGTFGALHALGGLGAEAGRRRLGRSVGAQGYGVAVVASVLLFLMSTIPGILTLVGATQMRQQATSSRP